mmetsp:Transcript_5060/g.7443  ORF Transcript_5060/g.7443 Transcript_5060/m.7443 type:complete len:97 (+) Transcript_5060:46-336(+)|eukprot:scaffold133630_cov39-Tisochrysis_lutea.AAC.1
MSSTRRGLRQTPASHISYTVATVIRYMHRHVEGMLGPSHVGTCCAGRAAKQIHMASPLGPHMWHHLKPNGHACACSLNLSKFMIGPPLVVNGRAAQ